MGQVIFKKISYSDIISHVPGLFPYIENDAYGNVTIHSAMDSTNGCFHKVIPSLKVNGKVYSYKELMNKYYSGDESIISFVEKSIGKFKVDGVNGNLVPEYMYYPEMKKLYEWMMKYSTVCDCSNYSYSENLDLCCICKKFCDYGGTDMIAFLREKLSECEQIASDNLNLVVNDGLFGYLNFNISLTEDIYDLGIETEYAEEWIPGKEYYYGDIVIYDNNTYELINEDYLTKPYCGDYDEEICEIFFNKNNDWKNVKDKVEGVNNWMEDNKGNSESKLVSLRRTKRFLNDDGTETQIPSENENIDWLCLYQKGLVLNIQTIVDENGNIKYYGGNYNNLYEADDSNIYSVGDNLPSDYSNKLIAYGDVITDIIINENETSITFKYSIGCHLIGNGLSIDTGETKFDYTTYSFENFSIDEENNGVSYEETYYYDPDVFGNYDLNNPDESAKNGIYGVFNTSSLKVDIVKNFSDETVLTSERISNSISKKSIGDTIYSQNIRKDEFLGVTFLPIVEKDILVDRGVNAAFERHLKLGEVRTLDDLENYGNGGFFNIQNLTE